EDFCDVAFRGGKFYAFTCRGLVITVDPDSLNINRVVPTEKPVREIGFPYHEFLVVESHGDLFSVCASEDRKHVVRIEVKRLDEAQHEWVDVKDELKDRVLFVGDICRFSVSAKDYPGYKANCVYFFNYYGRSRQPQPYCHHQDTHFLILDVEDGQARRFCNHSGCSHYFSTLPTWLSEKPSYLNLALQEAFISKWLYRCAPNSFPPPAILYDLVECHTYWNCTIHGLMLQYTELLALLGVNIKKERNQFLSGQCSSSSFPGRKLLFQSDLYIASLSNHLHDLDLLLRSGVLHQSGAIVLSHPAPGSHKDDLVFFIHDLFTRLQIGGVEFKRKALESLLKVLNDDEKSASLVAKEGNMGYLIGLLDFNNYHFSIREQAVTAVSILASAGDESRKIMFEEGGLGHLLRTLESGSTPLKEKAAIEVEAITADPDNGGAISAYGGVSILIEACRSGSQATQTHAVGAIRNAATPHTVQGQTSRDTTNLAALLLSVTQKQQQW
ncbi:hypothetical protein Tsubulata_041833, partial [Turnera subulata]